MTRSFLTQFAALTLASFAVLFGLKSAFGLGVVHPLAPYVLAGLLALTLLTYWLMAWVTRHSPDNFLVAYLGGVGVRLLVGISLVIGYFLRGGLHEKHGILTFLGIFFISYFLCAGFEIWAIFSNLRPFSAIQPPKND